jgi:hypothetical protein
LKKIVTNLTETEPKRSLACPTSRSSRSQNENFSAFEVKRVRLQLPTGLIIPNTWFLLPVPEDFERF